MTDTESTPVLQTTEERIKTVRTNLREARWRLGLIDSEKTDRDLSIALDHLYDAVNELVRIVAGQAQP